MLDVQAPIHWTRKSRYVNATSVRRMVRAPAEGLGATVESVATVGWAWTDSAKSVSK
jgi:hypothetical protein